MTLDDTLIGRLSSLDETGLWNCEINKNFH
jgi:hypothetical protein